MFQALRHKYPYDEVSRAQIMAAICNGFPINETPEREIDRIGKNKEANTKGPDTVQHNDLSTGCTINSE